MAAEILDWESLNFIVSQNNQTGRNQFLSKMNKGDRKSVLQLSKILKLSIYHTHSQNSSVFQWRCSEITFLLFKFKSYLLLLDQAFSKLVMILKLCLLCALCRVALFLLTLHLTSRLSGSTLVWLPVKYLVCPSHLVCGSCDFSRLLADFKPGPHVFFTEGKVSSPRWAIFSQWWKYQLSYRFRRRK